MYNAGSPNQYAETASISQKGNGYFDGTVRCKSGLNVDDPAILPIICAILSSGAIVSQSTISAIGIISANGDISSVGSISAGTAFGAGGTISTVGNITASAGTISGKNGPFQNLVLTRGTAKPSIPTSAGVYLGVDSSNTAAGIEICASTLQYIDFTAPGIDFKGRIIYGFGSNDFQFCINQSSFAKMSLNSHGLYVGGTLVSASDKRQVQQEAFIQRLRYHQQTRTS